MPNSEVSLNASAEYLRKTTRKVICRLLFDDLDESGTRFKILTPEERFCLTWLTEFRLHPDESEAE